MSETIIEVIRILAGTKMITASVIMLGLTTMTWIIARAATYETRMRYTPRYVKENDKQ